MNKQESINKIKEQLKSLFKFASDLKKQNYTTLTLTDGTNITTSGDDIAVDADVYQLDDQGNQTPLDNGDYVLQDCRTFTVVDNKVTVVSEAPTDGTQVETPDDGTKEGQKMTSDGLPEGQASPSTDGTDVESRIATLENQIAEILNILDKIGGSQNEINDQMMSRVVKVEEVQSNLSNEPGDKPIQNTKKGYEVYDKTKSAVKKSRQVMEEIREIMKENRKRNNQYLI